jgi:hypothetical protein
LIIQARGVSEHLPRYAPLHAHTSSMEENFRTDPYSTIQQELV